MLSKYYSNWILSLFVIRYIGYLLKIPITRFINPYYSLLVICGGYTLLILYLICYKHYQFDTSFLGVITLLHFVPLYIMYKLPRQRYAMETLVISFFLYILYLGTLGTDIYTVYLIDAHPTKWPKVSFKNWNNILNLI